jgi:dipeptidase
MREVWDWDGSFYLGSVPEAEHTYNVVGNVNEHGLMIGETTFGGVGDLDGHGTPNNIIDYGSLIWMTLQRARTAREAIQTMDHLAQTYGYASDGESFSVADPTEIWIMEMMSKGKYGRGSVWVASKVPEGSICAHANQARTRTFAQNDPNNVLFSADVVTFAQSVGLYPKNASAAAFDFSAAYDPISFGGARFSDARVWNIFNLATAPGYMNSWLTYAQGHYNRHHVNQSISIHIYRLQPQQPHAPFRDAQPQTLR